MRKNAKIKFARQLRQNMTDAETRLWFHLRRRQLNNFRFRKQHSIGPYIADFVCIEAHLVVEIDGSQHLESSSDAARDVWMRDNNFRVLRFWNHDVLNRIDEVLGMIVDMLTSTQPPSALRAPCTRHVHMARPAGSIRCKHRQSCRCFPASQGKGKSGEFHS